MFGNAFKLQAHYVFNYKPRYYDERKERLTNLQNKYKNKEESTTNSPKFRLTKNQLKSDWKRQKKIASSRGVNLRLAIIITILVGISAYLFELHKLF